MAKGAAKELDLGRVHALVTKVFTKVLEKYLEDLERVDVPTDAEIEDDMAAVVVDLGPNPAMMGAITKFLKDNSVAFDDEAVKGLSNLQQSLDQRKKARSNVVSLTTLKAVGDE